MTVPEEPLPEGRGTPTPEPDVVSKFVRELRATRAEARHDPPAPPAAPEPPTAPAVPPAPAPATASPIPPAAPPAGPPADSLDDLLALAQPFASASAQKSESIRWIAERAALGVLRLCLRAANDPGGGLSFGAADVHAVDPQLSDLFESANTIGNVLGDKGQRGKDGRVHEEGMDLPPLKPGKGGRQFSPSVEAAAQAVKKLRSRFWTDEAIAAELGLPDVASLKARLSGLWSHGRYAAAYPRGRRSLGR